MAKFFIRFDHRHPAPRSSFDVSLEDEIGLVDFLNRVRLLADCDGQGSDTYGTAPKFEDRRFQDPLVHFVESVLVDFEDGEGGVGDGFGDATVVADLGEVADAAEEVVGDARRAAAAAGDFDETTFPCP